MKSILINITLSGILAGAFTAHAKPVSIPIWKKFETFAASKEPGTADWRYFHRLNELEKAQLWNHFAKQNKKLQYWHWGWRLAWVRSCELDRSPHCQSILREGLHDRALFVRAEAAEVIGNRFRGTQNLAALSALKEAYENPRNLRNGKPLIVQQRILYAMHLIGGEAAKQGASRLAASSQQTLNYWRRLAPM